MSVTAAVKFSPPPASHAWACFDGFGRTLFSTDGAVKIIKLVKEIFKVLAALGVTALDTLSDAVNWFSGYGDMVEAVNRTFQVLTKKADDWAAQISGIFYAAFRILIALKFIDKIKLINLEAITTAIGNVPVLGYVVQVPVDMVGSVSAIFDITHHSMQLHYKIALEAQEYRHAYERLNAQDNYFFNSKKDDYSDRESFVKHAKAHIEARIALSKEPSMDEDAINHRVQTQWAKFSKLANVDRSDYYYNDNKKAVRQYVAEKIVFEKRKYEIAEKNALDNATAKRVRSVVSIAYDTSKLMLFMSWIAVSLWSVSFLAVSSPFILGLCLVSAMIGVVRVVVNTVNNFKLPNYVQPNVIEEMENDIQEHVKSPLPNGKFDEEERKLGLSDNRWEIVTKASQYRELIEIR